VAKNGCISQLFELGDTQEIVFKATCAAWM
jgi:hypothetical protein